MDAARWERAQHLFHAALERPPAERQGFLETACDDATLVAAVLAMLDADARAGSLLDRPLSEFARDVLDGTVPLSRTIGPHRILSVIGQGGMGIVFLAEREDLGTRTAIKMLRDAWISPARRERFATEQRTLAQLEHPSIARLYDADTLPDGTPYFVMEYVDGVPLTTYCDRHAPTVRERLRIFREICEAVQHAHRYAIVHRDLKPSNIMVTHDGRVKLLDFGIAKQVADLDVPVQQTQTAQRLLTPAYAAPEQVSGGAIGTYTDVYALGVVLYELLAGRVPFDLAQLTPGRAETIILEQEPDKPTLAARRDGEDSPARARIAALGRTAQAELDVLCLTAMHKDPQRRYRTVDALIRDIDHFLAGEPLDAKKDTFAYRAERFARRHARALAAAAVMLGVVIALVAFYTLRLAAARDAALAEVERTQRIQRFMLNLFEGDATGAGPADTLRVITLIERGVQQARTLDAEPRVQAELYQTLGELYQRLGDLERADSLLVLALEQRRTVLAEEHVDVAASLMALGLLRADQADLEEAESLARAALEMGRRTAPPEHPHIAHATRALGHILQSRGRYEESIAMLNEAARLQRVHGHDEIELAATLHELSNSHFYVGEYEVTDSLSRALVVLNRRLHGERHPSVANSIINVGAVHFELGRYAEAEAVFREGLAMKSTYYGPDHDQTAAALIMLSRPLVAQERYDEALGLVRRALEIRELVYGPEHPRVASILNELGNIAGGKDDLDAAEAYYRRMANIYVATYGETHYLLGIAYSNVAGVLIRKADYAEAEQLMERVVALFTATLAADHLNTGIARVRLGLALLRQQRLADAERETLAGYEIIGPRMAPSARWLIIALENLVEIYEKLGRNDDAERWRAQLAAARAATAP
jgi:eukaryotic-like serine/threonine-protein kinase